MASTDFESVEALLVAPPMHPVPQLQGPFEESMIESVNDVVDQASNMDSVERRTLLLEMPTYERVIAGRWKQKPGERYHPLWKITAQMSFGMHLLAEGLARSEEDVMRILQNHIDDIDGFLERTTDDFDLAQSDVQERLNYLKLPLQHVQVFDRMLEDRAFRMSIVEGNEKIEHIVERTSEAMKDSLKDVQKGLDATKAFASYLSDLGRTWIRSAPEHESVYYAMIGNVEGWSRAFKDLYQQGNTLGKTLIQLSDIVSEMQRRAGIVSRKMLIRPRSSAQMLAQRPGAGSRQSSSVSNGQHRSSRQTHLSQLEPQKPLPTAPSSRLSKRPSAPNALPRQSPSTEKQAILQEKGASETLASRNVSANPPIAQGSGTSSSSSPPNQTGRPAPISELAGNEISPLQIKPLTELPAEVPQLLPGSTYAQKETSVQEGRRIEMAAPGPPSENFQSVLSPDKYNTNDGLGILGLSGFADPARDTTASTEVRMSISRNPTFTSHPPGTTMSTKPVLPGNGTVQPVELPSGEPRRDLASESSSRQNSYQSKSGASGGNARTELDQPVPGRHDSNNFGNQESHYSGDLSGYRPSPTRSHSSPHSSTLLEAMARRKILGHSSLDDQDAGRGKRPFSGDLKRTTTGDFSALPESKADNMLVAEMEGSSPLLLAPLTYSPIELEAPEKRLRLPPRPRVEPSEKADDAPSSAIPLRPDFVQLPYSQTGVGGLGLILAKLDTTPFSQDHALKSLSLGAQRPGQAPENKVSNVAKGHSLNIPRKLPLRLIGDDVIERISYTPPDSPIHARSTSEASSSNSARMMGDRPSRALAPPAEAPPPPGPGGRAMVNPNYAAAGAFEGERKQPRSRGGSGSSWKRFLSGITSSSSNVLDLPGTRPGSSYADRGGAGSSSSVPNSGLDLMTAAGKDVLWFKGMSKEGVWVSS